MQYVRIKEAIAEQIDAGSLLPRQKLPPERQLAESFNTTRVTLREALSLLEAEGQIYREDRRGWFISPPPLRYNPSQAVDLVTAARAQNRQPDMTIINAKAMLADKVATRLLALAPFADVYRIERLLHLEQRPVAYVTSYVPPQLCPNLLRFDLAQSMSLVLREHFALEYHSISYRVTTSALFGDVALALRATAGTPALVIERKHYDHKGNLLNAETELWRHDAICLASEAILTPVSA
ncbi:UTRA domain-containing protein [Vibrio sp. ABG19]|uniref:UTRA domain-containing protein n=1 Tax=Vibrio sp. ABG19 TaxID=2817385 RepID=UPI00249ED2C7|nr:UTRA domain-containing protein [Vibrio sp. ABG19]WGY45162.1 UTRA domain-containing protein [Vibrio sp. ABG19]